MNAKRILVAAILLLILSGLTFFFWGQYKNKINRENLFPLINTSGLPSGTVGELYQAELIGSLVGAKAKLEIKALEVPEGLSLADCKQEYNVSYVPKKPNSFIKCNLSGYPVKTGMFSTSFEINAEGYYSNSKSDFLLFINQ